MADNRYDWRAMGTLPPTFTSPNPRIESDWGKYEEDLGLDNLSPLTEFEKDLLKNRDKVLITDLFSKQVIGEVRVFLTSFNGSKLEAIKHVRGYTKMPATDCAALVIHLLKEIDAERIHKSI